MGTRWIIFVSIVVLLSIDWLFEAVKASGWPTYTDQIRAWGREDPNVYWFIVAVLVFLALHFYPWQGEYR